MLYTIIGRSGEARKDALYRQLRERLQSESGRIILLVPEQSSFAREREILLQFGAKDASRVEICGFSRLAQTILHEEGVPVKPQIDDAGRAVLMSLAAESVRDSLQIYAAHAGHTGLLGELLQTRDELRQASLTPEQLAGVGGRLTAASLTRKTRELALIFEAYDALVGRRFADKNDNITVLTALLKTRRPLSGAAVLADDFRGFTGQEYLCLEQLLRQCACVCVTLCAEQNAENDEGSAFTHAARGRQVLCGLARKNNVPVREELLPAQEPHGQNAAPAALEKRLYNPYEEPYMQEAGDVTIIAAQDKYAECDAVAAQAAQLLREGGCRARDIAVVERGEGTYRDAVVSALKRFQVPVFEDTRRPLSSFPLVRLVLAACEAAGRGLTTEAVLKALKTGLYGFTPTEYGMLENYTYIWRIDTAWKTPWTGHPEGFGRAAGESDLADLAVLNSLRARAVQPLLRLRAALRDADGRKSCGAVYAFLEEIDAAQHLRARAVALNADGNVREAVECGRIWDVLMELLDALAEAIGAQTVQPARFAELLTIMINAADLGDIPHGIDEVAVGAAERIRLAAPKVVFVLGVNEGVFPAPAQTGGIFSENEREQLRRAELPLGEPPENLCAEERLLVYSIITAPTEKLFLSYSAANLRGDAAYPSALIGMVKNALPYCRTIDAAKYTALERTGSEQTAFENAALLYRENTPEAAAFRAYVRTNPAYAKRLAAVERASRETSFSFETPAAARRLFDGNVRLSPSRIETYHKCAFQYFCRYGLGAEPPRVAELDPALSGQLIHYVLEKLLSACPGEALRRLSPDELRERVHALTAEYVAAFMGDTASMPLRLRYRLERTEKTILEIAERLREELGNCRFVTRDVELSVSDSGGVAPYTVRLPDGEKLTVTGFIDRVDVMEEDGKSYFRIVDYKTGGKEFKLSDVDEGLNMQMLLYLLCIWENGRDRYGNVVPAGILYVPAKTGGMVLGRDATPEEIEKQRVRNGRMNGLVLREQTVILGMDSGGAGKFINAYLNKDGEIKGSTVSLEGFTALQASIREKLSRMAQNLKNGVVEALPVSGSGYQNICSYCAYAPVCCHETGDRVRLLGGNAGEEDLSDGMDA